MKSTCIKVPNIMLPGEGTDLSRWSVVACDQYTSQPEYWQETADIVGDAPSTLNMILPEVYLEDGSVKERTEKINATMENYLAEGILKELPAGFVLTERSTGDGPSRKGLVVAIDLEQYSYEEGAFSLIRPTEKTVVDRIPPRLAVRKDAKIEIPHIMVLIDDPKHTVIEPLFDKANELSILYDTDLMQKGGHIKGWFIPEGKLTDQIMEAVEDLMNRKDFNEKYGLTKDLPMLNMAVGDGNHSLATAKANWELKKASLSEKEQENHPARFCLCELVNVHDESLIIEPIHRVAFHVEPEKLLEEAVSFFGAEGCETIISHEILKAGKGEQVVPFYYAGREGTLVLKKSRWGITLGALQAFLDDYCGKHPETKLDYIHGDDICKELGQEHGNMAFLLPALEKMDLFKGVVIDGVLPRKTFSMGEANEKRYYMEAKRI